MFKNKKAEVTSITSTEETLLKEIHLKSKTILKLIQPTSNQPMMQLYLVVWVISFFVDKPLLDGLPQLYLRSLTDLFLYLDQYILIP